MIWIKLLSKNLSSLGCASSNCQAVNSSKKRTNEFIFTSMRRVFVRFLEEIKDSKNAFRNYLTFSTNKHELLWYFFPLCQIKPKNYWTTSNFYSKICNLVVAPRLRIQSKGWILISIFFSANRSPIRDWIFYSSCCKMSLETPRPPNLSTRPTTQVI